MSFETKRSLHMRQSPMTIHYYMHKVQRDLDEIFGPGFTEEHPEIWQRLVTSCTLQYAADVIADAIESIRKK